MAQLSADIFSYLVHVMSLSELWELTRINKTIRKLMFQERVLKYITYYEFNSYLFPQLDISIDICQIKIERYNYDQINKDGLIKTFANFTMDAIQQNKMTKDRIINYMEVPICPSIHMEVFAGEYLVSGRVETKEVVRQILYNTYAELIMDIQDYLWDLGKQHGLVYLLSNLIPNIRIEHIFAIINRFRNAQCLNDLAPVAAKIRDLSLNMLFECSCLGSDILEDLEKTGLFELTDTTMEYILENPSDVAWVLTDEMLDRVIMKGCEKSYPGTKEFLDEKLDRMSD